MPTGAAISGGLAAAGSLGGAALGYFGSQKASQQQADTANRALGMQQGMFDTAKGALAPFITAGTNALPTLSALLTPGANMTSTLSQIPGFQFAQDWGQQAVRNQGTTMGLGGNVLSSGAKFATGLAQNGFGQIVSALQNLTGTGASAGGALAGNALGAGQTMGSTLGSLGTAQAAGTLGGANALSGGLSGATSAAGNAFLLSNLFNKFGVGRSDGVYQQTSPDFPPETAP